MQRPMQRSTLVFISLFAACGAFAACGTLEVPSEDEVTGNPLEGPSLASVTPARGPLVGGNEVTLTGTGFSEGSSVIFGGSEVLSTTVESDTTILVTVPAGVEVERSQDVLIFGPAGFAELPAAYTYNTEPTLEAVSRSFGALAGGTTLEVTGRFLEANNPGTPTVTIGGVDATDVEVVDDSTIRFVTGAASADVVALPQDIVVATSNGSATLPEAFHFLRPGLLLTVYRDNSSTDFGIHYFDVDTGRTLQLFDLGVGVGRFFTLNDGTFLLRLNRQGINSREWARFDPRTESLDFAGPVVDEGGGTSLVRGTAQVGANLVALTNSRLGFVDPIGLRFTDMASDGTFTDSQGCLATKNNNEIFHINQLSGPVKTVNINTGNTVTGPNIISPLNNDPNNFKCHGAAIVGQFIIALIFDRNQPGSETHVLSINPVTGTSSEIALLGGAFAGLEFTPPGLFQ